MNNTRLVYTTESGRMCPSCGHPAAKCICKKKKTAKKHSIYPNDGIVRISRDVKGRKGKTVTAVFGVPLDDKKLHQFAKTLKRLCGTGGTVKDGIILIQGDHSKTLLNEIEKQGYTVKLAGG
jgi:translation initiation factor 1